jgi:uncharacterized protein (DUF169 family)
MTIIEDYAVKATELKNVLALQRLVGLKFCKSLDEIPSKARRPLRDFKYHMAICQAINQARSVGFTIGLELEDNFCLAGASVFGLTKFAYSFYPQHTRDQEAACKLDAIFNERDGLLPKGIYKAVVVSPFDRLQIEPDIIIAYGTPGQVGRIGKSFTWNGDTVSALYFGGLGCSAIILAFVQQKPILCIPAGGEKVLAGTNDYEMSIVFPASRLDDVLAGFKGTQRMLPYPTVCSTLMNEPSVPEDYHITYKELAEGN